MNQTEPKKPRRTFSVRLPMELYDELAKLSLTNNNSLNATIIELIEVGLAGAATERQAINRFILEIIPKDTLQELML